MSIIHQDALNDRANNLGTFNGARLVLVTLLPAGTPTTAQLEVTFYNKNHLHQILHDLTLHPSHLGSTFTLRGGQRLRAGSATGQVQITGIAAGGAANQLLLTVAPIGDYSTYTLVILADGFDPLLSEIPFKFRPGCFTNDCAPAWDPGVPAQPAPAIDYLAKDYDSFRHTLIAAMMQRVPGWQATSEADLDQVLIDLFAAAADELSDYQDRVMAEAFFGTARKRVSLARHARLMDYHIQQGNQSSSWLALEIDGTAAAAFTLPEGFLVWAGDPAQPAAGIPFATRAPATLKQIFNELQLYTWNDVIPSLSAGDTSADLVPASSFGGKADCDTIVADIQSGAITQLLIQEWLNPSTGRPAGANPDKRQLLRLLPGTAGAATMHDPVQDVWFVRITWQDEDQLKFNYCFTVFCPGTKVENCTLFHGNLALVHQGFPAQTVFRDTDAITGPNELHYERDPDLATRYGILCRLPSSPLAYLPTPTGGEIPPQSTLTVQVEIPGSGTETWEEVISLVHSDDESMDYAVETDERQRSLIRFGNGTNGMLLPPGTVVTCDYQVGGGAGGNVGRDTLDNFFTVLPADHNSLGVLRTYFENYFTLYPTTRVTACWNPFDVTDGADPEPVDKILRNAPEAYSARQLRAVTLCDYIARAEEVPGVSRAVASYAWTGSWRTVRIAVDPVGTSELTEPLYEAISAHLETVRLIGEDLEIRPPLFAPLAIEVSLCVSSDVWPEDVQYVLEQEFSDSYTPDGRMGFFHPDAWTFGQALHASQIEGRIHQVPGIEHIISISLKRWNDPTTPASDLVEVRFNEIIQVKNDPDAMELGYINFTLEGGRQ
ncbi:MAG TPA: hypothetical protein VK717_07765 [Opitutaceae bacterium]|jgi:hypothetical protein|nr:hypothetical protein [Opitutaceae bacterium]